MIEFIKDGVPDGKDLVEVVRCKDCVHYTEEPGKWMCEMYDWVHEGDWFCADGRRQEDIK